MRISSGLVSPISITITSEKGVALARTVGDEVGDGLDDIPAVLPPREPRQQAELEAHVGEAGPHHVVGALVRARVHLRLHLRLLRNIESITYTNYSAENFTQSMLPPTRSTTLPVTRGWRRTRRRRRTMRWKQKRRAHPLERLELLAQRLHLREHTRLERASLLLAAQHALQARHQRAHLLLPDRRACCSYTHKPRRSAVD